MEKNEALSHLENILSDPESKLSADEEAAVGYAMDTIRRAKTAKWKKNCNTFWSCSKCGFVNGFNRETYPYCPSCGARMTVEVKPISDVVKEYQKAILQGKDAADAIFELMTRLEEALDELNRHN